ncbi:Gfo/Idh/MocA family oxidoreductase [Planctomycetota bacterium]|nr:Gfo/Idh/MocA family oxidoreductase [Planctomycetota bacterium]
MDRVLNIAFIGLHHQHPRWYWPLWNYLPMYRPVAVCERDEAFLHSENELYQLDTYDEVDAVLERDDVDVVMIWEQHSLMPGMVEKAAKAGKHVIVEKPCAADLEGIRVIERVAKEYPDVKISSPYCWRTHRGSELIKQVVDRGDIGDVVAVEARLNAGGAMRYVRDHAMWMLSAEEGGGPMWNLGVHWIDYFQWLLGERVKEVCGQIGGPIGEPFRDIEDQAQSLLRFENGCVGVLDISYGLTESHPGKRDIYVSIRGTRGAVQWSPAWQSLDDNILIVRDGASDEVKQVEKAVVTSEAVEGYCGEMAKSWLEGFALSVIHDENPMVTVSDMVAAIEVVDAFKRSVTSKQFERVVAG